MTCIDLAQPADDLLLAALAFAQVAEAPGSSASLPGAALHLEETLRVVSAGLYKVARDAVPPVADRGRRDPSGQMAPTVGLSREQEVRLLATIHDLAAALGSCAGSCGEVRAIAEPLIGRSRIGHAVPPTAPTQPAHNGVVPAQH